MKGKERKGKERVTVTVTVTSIYKLHLHAMEGVRKRYKNTIVNSYKNSMTEYPDNVRTTMRSHT